MNVLTVFSAMAPYIRGRSLHELFPSQFMQNLPYENVQTHCCILCLRPMSKEEMFPRRRLTPRAICPECWGTVTNDVSDTCWICGEYLENGKIESQERRPRDLHFRIHEGKCRDYFSLVSAKALGKDTGIWDDVYERIHHQQVPETFAQQVRAAPQPEITEGLLEAWQVRPRPTRTLPALKHMARALPPPAELPRIPQNHFLGSLESMHKGKKVKVARKGRCIRW